HPAASRAVLAVVVGAGAGATAWWGIFGIAAACATLMIAWAILRRPEVGVVLFALLCLTVPFAVLPFRIVVAPTFVDVVLGALLAACIARALRRREPLVVAEPHLALALFVGLACAALLLGTAAAPSSSEDVRLFGKLMSGAILAFTAVQALRNDRGVSRTIRALIVGGAVAGGVAIVLYLLPTGTSITLLSALSPLGYPTGPDVMRPIEGTATLRATGTLIDPNVLGGTLMLPAILLAAEILAPTPVLRRGALVGFCLPMLLALALTYSRSAWVGLAAGLAYLAVVADRRLLAAVPIGLAVVAVAPQTHDYAGRLLAALTIQDQATAMRIEEYRNAANLISRFPMMGVGCGASPRVALSVGVSNLYLQMPEHMGLIGLAAFPLTVGLALTQSWRTPTTADNRLRRRGLEAALGAALIAGLFDHYFFDLRLPPMEALFWLIGP